MKKKLKVMAAALLASALPLSGCSILGFEIPGSQAIMDLLNKVDIFDIIPDKEDNKGDNTGDNTGGNTDDDHGGGDTDTTPKVLSVNIKIKGGSAVTSKTMNVGDVLELEAAVSVQNGAAQTVTWSSDKEAVATVVNGKVTALAAGTAHITATSTADTSKKAMVTIDVVIPNWEADIVNDMKSKFGEAIPYFGTDWTIEWDSDYDEFYAEADEADTENLQKLLEGAGFTWSYTGLDSYFGILHCYVAEKYTAADTRIVCSFMIDSDFGWFGASCEIYKEVAVSEFPAINMPYMDFDVETVPAINAPYYFLYGGNDQGWTIEAVSATETLEQYKQKLETAEWEVSYDEDEDLYVGYSKNGTLAMYLYEEGNIFVTVYPSLPIFEVFPSNYLDKFTSETLKSWFKVPAFNAEFFTYEEVEFYVDEEQTDTMPGVVIIAANQSKQYDIDAYASVLEENGFTILGLEDGDVYASLGKIFLEAYVTDDNEVEIDVWADSTVKEVPFTLAKHHLICLASETGIQIPTPVVLQGYEGTFAYTSSNEEVVTVDAAGNLTFLKEGSSNITVKLTTTEGSVEYTDVVVVDVVPKATGISIVAPTSLRAGKSVKLSFDVTPENSKAIGDVTYSVVSGGEYVELSTNGLLKVKETVVEEHEVKIGLSVGELVAEEVTIKVLPAGSEFDSAVDAVNEFMESIGITGDIQLPEVECDEIEHYFDEEYSCYSIECYGADVDLDDYADALEAMGYYVEADADDSYIAYNESETAAINVYYMDEDMFEIDIYPMIPLEDDVVFGDLGLENETLLADQEFVTASGYEIVFDKASGSIDPKYYTNGSQARCYAKNTITISAPEGEKLPEFTILGTSNSGGTLSANVGTLTSIDGGYSWSGNASEVVLTVSSSGQFRITEINLAAE